jgi:hypothetical protein
LVVILFNMWATLKAIKYSCQQYASCFLHN